jgi:signal transduction histidine kinase/CheY-like chemotaxis protein
MALSARQCQGAIIANSRWPKEPRAIMVSSQSPRDDDLETLLGEIVDFAIAITGSDFGNIQLLDATTGKLRIRAQRGFPQWWLDYWNGLGEGHGACHSTVKVGSRVFVEDVQQSAIFAGTPGLEVQRRAGVRSCQSTPIISRSGALLGVFSTHWKTVRHPDQRTLMLLDLLARQAAQIVELAQVEQTLRAAKSEAERANQAKSRFLAAASHDLRQPLSALMLYVSSLAVKLPATDQALLRSMEQCVSGLTDMLSDLLDLSRLEAGAVEPKISDFSIDAMFESIASTLEPRAHDKGLSMRCRTRGFYGHTDPILLRRIVTNLASNAIRYTERGGLLLACRRKSGKLWIEVWDTGIGIPEGMTTEIFEEFRQLENYERNREKGAGIGLSIVAKESALLGLTVRVASRVGRGSLFAVELPPGKPTARAEPRKLMPPPLRIALVEDNPVVGKALAHTLSVLGHTVLYGGCREDLLAQLNGSGPDIVVSDYRLAGNEDGYDIIAALRGKFGSGLPAMLITGDTDPAIIRDMLGRGIHVQHKPLDLDTFCTTLVRLTGRERRER